jgi:hypothetical protein
MVHTYNDLAAEEDEEEEEEEADHRSCFEYFDRTTSVYYSSKKVAIQSRALKLPFVCLNFFAICGIVGYELIYKLQFMKAVTSVGDTVVSVFPPLSNFWNCTNVDTDCEYRSINSSHYEYCSLDQNFSNIPFFGGCQYVDSRVVAPLKYTRAIFIATSVRRIQQKRVPCELKNRPWVATNDETFFITAIEDYMVKIRHSTASSAFEDGCSNFEMQGFVRFGSETNNTVKKFPCHTGARNANCTGRTLGLSSLWDAYDDCGNCQAGDRSLCSSSEWGDLLSVGKILEAAGVSLDETADALADGGWPKRLKGTSIVMEVVATNEKDYWSHPFFTMKYSYEYRFHEIALQGMSSNRLTRIVNETSETRTVEQYNGIPMMIDHTGELRVVSFYQAAYAIVVSMAALKICKLIVDVGLMNLYSMCCRSKGSAFIASKMYKHYTEEYTPSQDEFTGAVRTGDTNKLEEIEQKCYHRKAEQTVVSARNV